MGLGGEGSHGGGGALGVEGGEDREQGAAEVAEEDGGGAAADSAGVFTKGEIEHTVAAGLDAPALADLLIQRGGVGSGARLARHVVASRNTRLVNARQPGLARDPDQLARAGPV